MGLSRAPWSMQAEQVATVCAEILPHLVGVYLHGSAALGGFTAASDLDVLVVADGEADQQRLGRELLNTAVDFPLELSTVTSAAAAAPATPWPFLLHVASPDRIVSDQGKGDPDLIAHYAVTRQAGVAVRGADPADVIGAVPRTQLLSSLLGELAWGLDHADQRYAVLNACRAEAYATEGRLLSKMDGGHWWTQWHGPSELISTALDAQATGHDLGPCTPAARTIIENTLAILNQHG